MAFKKGETVVYPHHGASTIIDISKKTVNGREMEFLILDVQAGGLRIEVPSGNAEYVGVRDVVSKEGLQDVFNILRQPYIEEPTNWSRRYKANVEKIASGDVIKVAEVVRDLYRRQEDRGLSAGEKRILQKAIQILSSEVALAQKSDDVAATEKILEVLAA